MTGANVMLAHGRTLAELHALARLAVHTAYGAAEIAWHDRYETAHSAMAEHLFSTAVPPHTNDLVRIGRRAIHDTVSDYRHHHGFFKHKTIGTAAGPGSSPAFAVFWSEFGTTTPAVENSVVERVALPQILAALTPRQRAVLAALAALGDHRAAAQALGIEQQTYKALLGRARTSFRALWHEGETPSRQYRVDRRTPTAAVAG